MSSAAATKSPCNGEEDCLHEITPLRTEEAVIEKMQLEIEGEPVEARRTIEIDSKMSWLVALSCAWVMFWTLMVNRSNSLLYISLKKELNMTREESAAPFSMIGAVSNLFAIFSGVLIRRYPLFWTSLAGTLLSSVGVILAATIYNRVAITYCIGIITAIGQSLIFSTNMVAVNTYFDKNRATASGISYIGGSFVSFFLPFLYESLEQRLGFRTTLFLIGVFTLNALFGAIVLRYPPSRKQLNNNASKDESNQRPIARSIMKADEPFLQQVAFLKRPVFYLIVVTGIVFAYVLVLFNITTVDFAMEKHFSRHQALLTLWFYAGGDLFGRLFSGQLSDRGWLKRRTVMALTFFLASLAMFGLALVSNKIIHFGLCCLYGLSAGSTIILFSVLMTEYFTLTYLPLVIGVHCLINGLASLPRQRLIRYFSRGAGSYRPLYFFFSIITILTCMAWGIHCVFLLWRQRKDELTAKNGQRYEKKQEKPSDA